ncbi:MAG: thioredoxin family protein, partial [Chlamydiales bacterium]|nr:thioredoxin family protein [Chlamydiales bacterium]
EVSKRGAHSLCVPLLAYEPYDQKALGFQEIAEEDALIVPFSSSNQEIVSVKMISEEPAVVAGRPFWVAFQFTMGPEWHLYWKNPGDAGQGPSVQWNLPPGFKVSDLVWPAPERIQIEDSVIYGYSKHLVLLAQIFPPQGLETGSTVDIKADVDWFGCSTTCVPGKSSFDVKLPVAAEKVEPTKQVISIFKQARRALALDARHTKAQVTGNTLEISVHQEMPFSNIKSAFFMPEQANVLDTHQIPTWELSQDKKTLIVRLTSDKLQTTDVVYPLTGVLVVDEESTLGPLSAAWEVKVPRSKDTPLPSNFDKKYQSSTGVAVDEHLESLENKIWYRKLLTEFSLFIKSEFAKILLWAFLGGMLLNVMPCVLPVISFKLLHFVQLKGYSRMLVAKHGIMYSFGVLLSFWALSGTIYILQSLGHVVGWGFQLQEPVFVTCLIIVLFILALSLFGVFEFGVSVSSTTGTWEQSVRRPNEEPSYMSSFASGILATFVAAPCTGPLLGSAIGFAATLQPTYSFAIFSALGLGMAFPFLLISLFPGLTRFLPKPGRWMLTFKQLMGFFMLATVLWLIWVLDAQTFGLSNLLLMLSFFILAFGVWVYGNWCGFDRSKRTRVIGRIVAILLVGAGSWFFISNVQKARTNAQKMATKKPKVTSQVVGQEWETFSLARLQRLVQRGIPVFVDVTAKWCLTCQTNHLVLESDKVKQTFIELGVVKMKADWTMNDEEITRYIRSLGRNGVPVYAVYSPDPSVRPVVLPEVITQDMVIDALKKAHAEHAVK